ncbi:PAQR family membrane homeostasis protein TrhA [Bordetella petrii]|jgi:hemolysin III|uniref:Hemolysin III n=1 Tax=Bordetella petrii (strain ATCC BAA-461 / DSM 12804 / CCUG 43448 / CIP 107267 / Se-1111R) TaxID=340100 RepID=A9IUQ2_BORPD|nr:hemolysin III family protein [Bordetella petrii]CAP43572.1 hemolysin III [Bordetella petrii]
MSRTDRPQTFGEEIANSVSHGLGALGALLAAPLLIVGATRQGDAALIAGTAVFAASMCLLYLASALYHALPRGRAKRLFNVLDHSAIYLLIAGTYTPFTLGPLRGPWGWTLLALVWGLAALGVTLKASRRLDRPLLSTGLYLAMGWLVAIAVDPVLEHVPAGGLWLLLAGGLAYTAGVVFFVLDSRWRYAHFVWHLFVLAGTACHFFAALWYAMPVAA